MRIFAGGLAAETNVFSPLPTGLADYDLARAGDDATLRDAIVFGSSFRRYAQGAARFGGTIVQGMYGHALPAGLASRAVYESLRDEMLAELEAALPLDGALFTLHGSMVAKGYVDCESDIVQRARAILGPSAKIGVLLDLHCDLPDELIAAADVIVTFKEYPHIDVDERADELVNLVAEAIRGRLNPVMATCDCRMIGVYPTTNPSMRDFVDQHLQAVEGSRGVLSASLGHGFPQADAPTPGARALVVADGDEEMAISVAETLARAFHERRHEVTLLPPDMDEGLERALSSAAGHGPVVVAEVSDNPGGGAPSDATFVLRELLRRGVSNAGVALFWDPIAVSIATAAGAGTRLMLRLGGKMGPVSGDPLDLDVTVRGVAPALVQRWPQTQGHAEIPCGAVACLECDGINIIVGSIRHQTFGLELFTAFDIDPRSLDLLVLKSSNHFQAAYGPIASKVVHMDAPGALHLDPRRLDLRDAGTDRFPWVEEAWT